MFDSFLVPEKTVTTANGDGPAVEISSAAHRTFLALLRITSAQEQQSVDVSIWGSKDGETWQGKSVASFTQMFYPGEQPMLLELAGQPDIRFLRLHWEVNRWGRGSEMPTFEFDVRLTEVAPEMLR